MGKYTSTVAILVKEKLRIQNPWRELAGLAALIMELSWSVLWYRLFLQRGLDLSYTQAFVIIGAMLTAVYSLMRLTALFQTNFIIRRILLGFLLLANILVGLEALLYVNEAVSLGILIRRPVIAFRDMAKLLPAEFVLMLIVLFISWRGVALSSQHIAPDNMLGRFRTGVVMTFVYGLLLPVAGENPAPALYIFLFTSLIGLASSRMAVLSQIRGGQRVRLDRQWMLGLSLLVAGMVFVSMFVVGLISDRTFDIVGGFFVIVLVIVVRLLSPLMYWLVRGLFWIGDVLHLDEFFQELLELASNMRVVLQSMLAAIRDMFHFVNSEGIQSIWQYLVQTKAMFLLIVIVLVVILVMIAVRRFYDLEHTSEAQDNQSISIQQDWFKQFRSAMRRRFVQLSNRLEELLGLEDMRRHLAAMRIRRIYAALMKLSSRLGKSRPASRTPLEFLAVLVGLFPDNVGELDIITQAYIKVRYGDLPELQDDLFEVESAWQAVNSSGQQRLRQRVWALKRK